MTLATRIIPCLDVNDGRVVKGINFLNLKDAGDPVELANTYNLEGADELTFLDISASSSGSDTTLETVRKPRKRSSFRLQSAAEFVASLMSIDCYVLARIKSASIPLRFKDRN